MKRSSTELEELEVLEEPQFQRLPIDMLWRIALELPIKEVLRQCSVSTAYREMCENDYFWDLYCEYHFYLPPGYGTKGLAMFLYDFFQMIKDRTLIERKTLILLAQAYLSKKLHKDFNEIVEYWVNARNIISIELVGWWMDINVDDIDNVVKFYPIKDYSSQNSILFDKLLFNVFPKITSFYKDSFFIELRKVYDYIFVPCEYITKSLELIVLPFDINKFALFNISGHDPAINDIYNILSPYMDEELDIEQFNKFNKHHITSKIYQILVEFWMSRL